MIGLPVDENFLAHINSEAVELRLRRVQREIQILVVRQDNPFHVAQRNGDIVDVIRGVLSGSHNHVLYIVRLRGELLASDEQDHAAATAKVPQPALVISTAHNPSRSRAHGLQGLAMNPENPN